MEGVPPHLGALLLWAVVDITVRVAMGLGGTFQARIRPGSSACATFSILMYTHFLEDEK